MNRRYSLLVVIMLVGAANVLKAKLYNVDIHNEAGKKIRVWGHSGYTSGGVSLDPGEVIEGAIGFNKSVGGPIAWQIDGEKGFYHQILGCPWAVKIREGGNYNAKSRKFFGMVSSEGKWYETKTATLKRI